MKKYIAFIVLLLLSSLGVRFYTFFQEQTSYHGGQTVQFQSVLQEEPELSNRGQRFSVKDQFNQTMYITADAFPRYKYGQVLQIKGEVKERKLDDERTLYSLYYPEIQIKANDEYVVAGWANHFRDQSKMLFESILPPISASLLMGIVFGAKEDFPEAFFDALQITGVLHVIAASGMNVTFISAALLYGLGYCMRRQYALIAGGFGIVFYVFLVGFEPSIVRASIMGVLAFGASLLGRQHIAAYALIISAYVMLLVQPGFLFDLGFQLSFLATLGIIFIKPLIPIPQNFISESFSTTLAAQLGTLPFLLGTFGQVGLLSLLVNALVLWVVPVVMLFGSAAAIVGLVFAPLASLLLYVALPFLLFFEYVVAFFGKSGLVISLGKFPVIMWVGYYFFASAIVLFMKPKRQQEKRFLLSDL